VPDGATITGLRVEYEIRDGRIQSVGVDVSNLRINGHPVSDPVRARTVIEARLRAMPLPPDAMGLSGVRTFR
jgi:hypothetical protein